jgi:glycosyltransferase involved in cell wall biosynthesis
MNPKISIITSLYKGGDFVRGFLDDIITQTIFEEKCELIIIDANSPDNEKDIILEYQKKYPNIIYARLEADPGIYACWNTAIEMSRGEFVTNANVDDRKSIKTTRKQMSSMRISSSHTPRMKLLKRTRL